MSNYHKTLLATLALILAAGTPAFAIQRVAARFGVLEVRFGYAMPQGQYDGLPGLDFIFDETELVEFDADRVYKDGFALGLSYGQMLGGNWRASVAFDYARNEIKNPIFQRIGDYEYTITLPDKWTFHQYDLTLRGAFAFTDLSQMAWSPFVGLGVSTGLSTVRSPGYATESEFDFGMSLDFGLDVKLFQAADNRSFVALSSINSWNFLSSGERASHLQVGGGIKYFFKP